MGVQLLNRFLRKYCKNEITSIHFSDLTAKNICIDISIYIYRFLEKEELLEKMFYLCSLFKSFDINLIVVFDGKPPEHKNDIISKRKENRIKASNEYEKLKEIHKQRKMTKWEIEKLSLLKKQMIRITKNNIDDLKKLFEYYGIQYIESEGEADTTCKDLVKKHGCYACISDDMDLFVYNTSVILRSMSLSNQTFICYHLKKILKKLNMNEDQFKLLCILSGNDYYNDEHNIFYYYKQFLKYKNDVTEEKWIKWLSNKELITNENKDKITRVLDIYNVESDFNNLKKQLKVVKKINIIQLKKILEKENFIFPIL